jgi:hypothetical protein
MANLERYLDPLFRPPLSLSVVASSLKYVATVVILGEPLLLTRSDYISRREDASSWACTKRMIQLIARVIFVGFAAYGLMIDTGALSEGFEHLTPWQRVHFTVMVLAFSPNMVAAVAGMFIPLVKMSWHVSLPVHSSVVGKVSNGVVMVFAVVSSLFYLLPLAFVFLPYALLGGCAITYALVCDMVTMPWTLFSGDLSSVWICLPVLATVMLSHTLVIMLISGQAMLFEKRYPELAQRCKESGKRDVAMSAMKLTKMPEHVIGAVRDLHSEMVRQSAKVRDIELIEGGKHELLEEGTPPFLNVNGTGKGMAADWNRANDKCILSDQSLACIFYLKVLMCVFMPLLQLSVIVAAKVFLGASMWQAASSAFTERSWGHYVQHVSSAGAPGAPKLLWYYL